MIPWTASSEDSLSTKDFTEEISFNDAENGQASRDATHTGDDVAMLAFQSSAGPHDSPVQNHTVLSTALLADASEKVRERDLTIK